MITVKLRYSDGQITIRQFKDKKEAEWFIHNEGDHLLEASCLTSLLYQTEFSCQVLLDNSNQKYG